jgi:hypothetical protein
MAYREKRKFQCTTQAAQEAAQMCTGLVAFDALGAKFASQKAQNFATLEFL